MHALEFNAKYKDGRIPVPADIPLADGQEVRVLILLDETLESPAERSLSDADVIERTSGAWQGEPMERGPQGEYERRLKLP